MTIVDYSVIRVLMWNNEMHIKHTPDCVFLNSLQINKIPTNITEMNYSVSKNVLPETRFYYVLICSNNYI